MLSKISFITILSNIRILEEILDFEYAVLSYDPTAQSPFDCEIITQNPEIACGYLQNMNIAFTIAPIAEEDWLVKNEKDFEPFSIGKFFICHDYHPHLTPNGQTRIKINAGMAFGTGRHQTTAACMNLMTSLENIPIYNIMDCGTGTGILAITARHLWQDAQILATDNDPIAIENCRKNFTINQLPPIKTAIAKGFNHHIIRQNANYDLIIANILFPPLWQMAPKFPNFAQKYLILSGLLRHQADKIMRRYANFGFKTLARIDDGAWTGLLFIVN